MLRGVLEQLGEMGNLVPRYTAPRCLLARQAVGGCDLCQTACPHAAIDLTNGGMSVAVDPVACTGCGLCVQSCPTGALEYDLQGPLQALVDQRRAGAGAGGTGAVLACSQSAADAEGAAPQLPCLGRVTPALVSAAVTWDLPLHLLHGDCSGCPVGAPDVPTRLAEVTQQAQQLQRATGRRVQVTVRRARAEDTQQEARLSRRGAFRAMWRVGQKQVAQQLPERPLPFVDWSEPQQRVPEEWKWRKNTVQPGLAAASVLDWPAPTVDDKCIDCPVCANVCPTEAIMRELTPAGGVRLLLNLSACTGCMGCVRSCPPQAMHQQQHWQAAALDALVLLRESDTVM